MKDDYKQLIKVIEKVQKEIWENEKKKRNLGTRKNPYCVYVTQRLYNYLKKHNLIDKDNMYLAYCGWSRVIVVEIK